MGEVPTEEVITYNESRIEEALAAGHDFLFVDASRSLDPRLVGLCDIADLILCPVGRTRETDRHSSLETDSLLRTWAFLSKQLGPEKLDRCFRGVLSDHIDARESTRMDKLEAESLQIDKTPKFSEAVQHIFVEDSHIKFLKNSAQHSTSSWRIYSWLRNQEPDLWTLLKPNRRKRNQVSDGLKRLLEDEACENLLFDFAVLLDEMNGIFRESDKTSDNRPITLFQLREKMTQLRQEQFDSHV